MENQFSRTELLIGSEGVRRLAESRVAVFGIGGVGGYTVEALARSGIGTLDLIDSDRVCVSNINRQILATHRTVGRYKVDVAAERIAEINPEAKVNRYRIFYLPETAELFDFSAYDYVVDAIDTVAGKLQLVCQAEAAGTPVISSMGAGNKMDPTAFRVADIYETSVCPLARVMRRELRKRGIRRLKVVYSTEPAQILPGEAGGTGGEKPEEACVAGSVGGEKPEELCAAGSVGGGKMEELCAAGAAGRKQRVPGSNAFVPSVAGLILAGEVIRDLLAQPES